MGRQQGLFREKEIAGPRRLAAFRRALAAGASVAALGLANLALAQEDDVDQVPTAGAEDEAGGATDEIVVTGARIPRKEFSTAAISR
jgi:hypothetical protein